MPLILASSSPIRHIMLEQAGVPHQLVPANIDETAIKCAGQGAVATAAQLAAAKALHVSAGDPDAWVIGSDSIATVAGRQLDKPRSRAEAVEHLRLFSGQSMQLTSAVALARNRAVVWSHAEVATLGVRPLSPEFIESYLDAEWPEVGYCMGVFRLEGPGVQLFESIDGDFFTILGMPLLPLLGALRKQGVISS